MGDSFITIIAIFLAAILMFVFPLMAMSERTDDVAQLAVQTATTDFVDNVRTTGKLSSDDYDKFLQTIASTGNSFDVDIEVQILDENPGVKTTQAEMTKIGENIKGSQVKTLCNLVRDNNLTKDDSETFEIKINNTSDPTEINKLKNSIANGKTYKVEATYGSNKLIDSISFEESKENK